MSSAAATLAPKIPAAARAAAPATCVHCGTGLAGHQDRFCCTGCAAAYAIIHDLGLDQFYRRRDHREQLRPAPDIAKDYVGHVATDKAGHSILHLIVDGVTCGACVWLIESVLGREPDILEARVNLTTRRLVIRWNGPPADANRYARRVAALGFRLFPFDPDRMLATTNRTEQELQRAMAVAGFAAGNVMLLSVAVWSGYVQDMGPATRDLLHWVSALIALPAIAYAGRPFFRSALTALRGGRTNMDVPISIGVLLAAGMSLFETSASGVHAYFDSAVTLLFFLLVGRYLDARARGRARSAAENLISVAATAVTVLSADGTTSLKSPTAVMKGEHVLVAAGERIGVDGCVTDGRSDLDCSIVTGETVPQSVAPGASVFAGMINLSAPLRITVTAAGDATLLAEIVRLMEAAERGRSRFVALADRVARAYAPVVHILAAATFVGWYVLAGIGGHAAAMNAIAVLIITCPCALALAIPVVQVVASARLMRQGILLKSATALERLAEVDTIVFDKTGTLTLGRLTLQPDARRSEADLRLAASIAQSSRHPLARALVCACPEITVLAGVTEKPGCGLVLAQANGEIRLGSRSFCGVPEDSRDNAGPELWLAIPGREPVHFTFVDEIRPDTAAVVRELDRLGFNVRVLSGDRATVVQHVAEAAGIDNWEAGCHPAVKSAELATLRAAGRHVLMVGDGLNDAPALSAADVSASPATAADISQAAADIVFQGDRLAPVLEVLTVARTTRALSLQNLTLAVLYNLAAVPLAVAGFVTPLLAAIAMSTSSLIVIANAMRLGRARTP